MIAKVGLLKKGCENLVDLAYECYIAWEYNVSNDALGYQNTLVNEFKRTFSRESVNIHFVGLWDSVNSVGILRDKMFPYTSRTKNIAHVRHAVSIDERRGKFKQCLFQPYSYCPNKFNIKVPYIEVGDDCSDNVTPSSFSEPASIHSYISGTSSHKSLPPLVTVSRNSVSTTGYGVSDSLMESEVNHKQLFFDFKNSDDVIEKWFCGDHCDVGGGWEPSEKGNLLSNIPFKWIVSEAIKFGIVFKQNELDRLANESKTYEELVSCRHDSLLFSETHWWGKLINNLFGWLSPVKPKIDGNGNDICNTNYFYQTLLWWMSEILPLGTNIEDKNGKWKSYYMPNLGRPRKIPKNAEFHWSVYWKLQLDPSYRPTNLPFDITTKSQSFNDEFYAGELNKKNMPDDLLFALESI